MLSARVLGGENVYKVSGRKIWVALEVLLVEGEGLSSSLAAYLDELALVEVDSENEDLGIRSQQCGE